MSRGLKLAVLAAFAFAVARPDTPPIPGGPLLVDDAATLRALEDRGFSFDRVVGARFRDVIAGVIAEDEAEFMRGAAPDDPRRPFKPEWLSRGRFELVGVVNRIDRRVFDPSGCGEVRLVYRLALKNPKRKATRLPMTVNVRIPQPKVGGESDCRSVAASWLARSDLDQRLRALGPASEIEINYQSIHVPSTRTDMDDNAEYVLREFRVDGDRLVEEGLFNTPRADTGSLLASWIAKNLDAIDAGRAVLPEAYLATRSVSRSPRGHMHAQNRPFSSLIRELPLGEAAGAVFTRIKTPALLMRRLDEMTCAGCHQTRSVAGFHLLGEERSDDAFNALAVGHSPHLGADLEWRARDLAAAARGELAEPRPFAASPDGTAGSECGIAPGLAEWRCAAGLECRDLHHGPWGVCGTPRSAGRDATPGEPCEDVVVTPSDRVFGPLVVAKPADAACPAPTGAMEHGAFCAPNWLGFTGGMCSERCDDVGTLRGGAICASLPAAGYEADCFFGDEKIEPCLASHSVTAWIASCDAFHPCRDDYGCARVPHAPAGIGACVPPYFVFQARVDGPERDR